nr:Fur family transcriptional regulator [Streptomyces sp. BA2]
MVVLEVLARCQDFISAQRLHSLLVAEDLRISLSTVYRALRELETADSVDVVRDDVGERLYRLRPEDGHRHYLICRSCGRSWPVDSEDVEQWAERIAADHGFAAVEHTVELTGVCGDCQPASDEGESLSCHPDSGRRTPAHRARSYAS